MTNAQSLDKKHMRKVSTAADFFVEKIDAKPQWLVQRQQLELHLLTAYYKRLSAVSRCRATNV